MSVTVFLSPSLPLSIPFSPWICTVAHEGASIAHTAIANVLGCFAAFAGKSQRLPYALHKVFPGALMTAANWEREGTTEQQSVSQSTLSLSLSPLTNDAQPAIVGDFLPCTTGLQWASSVRIEVRMPHRRGVTQDATICMNDIHKARIARAQTTIRAVALEEWQCRIQCRYPCQLDAPLLQLFARKASHLGAQAEPNEMNMLGGIATGDQIAQETCQITRCHR